MNRRIRLTGNKLLSPLRHEATSPASVGFHHRRTESKMYSVYFLFQSGLMQRAANRSFPVGNAEADQNTENRVTSWPQAQTAETAAVIKTEVVGHTMETLYELVMIQILLFAPDPDNPFWSAEKPLSMLKITNCSIFSR